MIRAALILLAAIAPIAARAEFQTASSSWDGTVAPRGDAVLRIEAMAIHDEARRTYHVTPLAWSDTLAADALVHARAMARSGVFAHDTQVERSVPQGENLSMGTRGAYSYGELVRFWADERVDFRAGRFPDISRTGNWMRVGHYTQMVWPETREVGCAFASNANHDYLVCRYLPAGNVVGIAMR